MLNLLLDLVLNLLLNINIKHLRDDGLNIVGDGFFIGLFGCIIDGLCANIMKNSGVLFTLSFYRNLLRLDLFYNGWDGN